MGAHRRNVENRDGGLPQLRELLSPPFESRVAAMARPAPAAPLHPRASASSSVAPRPPGPPPQALLTRPAALALRGRLLDDAWLFDNDRAYAAGVEDALAACATVPGLEALGEALRVPAGELARTEDQPGPPGGRSE